MFNKDNILNMKTIKFFFAIIFPALLIYSCEEVGPYINLTPPNIDTSLIDTTYIASSSETPQTKMILIEDFTGASCPNCPTAANTIKLLHDNNPDRILATAIHFNFPIVGKPVEKSKFDFRTTYGRSIFDMLTGQKDHLPIGAVNRTKHVDNKGNNVVLQDYTAWSTFVNEELTKTSPVNIDITGAFSDSIYKLKVKLHYTQALADTEALTVYMIEDSIFDFQKLPDNSIDSDYHHNHILRSVLSNVNGDDLKAPLVLNRVFEKEYKIELDPKWVRLNCKIIAFVHKKGNNNFDIIQAMQKALY
jgi:hypothetical protein